MIKKLKLLLAAREVMQAVDTTQWDWRKTHWKGIEAVALDFVKLTGILVMLVLTNPDYISDLLLRIGASPSLVLALAPLLSYFLGSIRNAYKHEAGEALRAAAVKVEER